MIELSSLDFNSHTLGKVDDFLLPRRHFALVYKALRVETRLQCFTLDSVERLVRLLTSFCHLVAFFLFGQSPQSVVLFAL